LCDSHIFRENHLLSNEIKVLSVFFAEKLLLNLRKCSEMFVNLSDLSEVIRSKKRLM